MNGFFLHADWQTLARKRGKRANRRGGTICGWLTEGSLILQCQKKLIRTPWERQRPQRRPTTTSVLQPPWRRWTSPWSMKSSWQQPPAGQSCPATAAPSRSAWWSSSPASWSPPWPTASTRTDPPSRTSAWCSSRPDWCSWRPASSAGRWDWRGRRRGGGRAKPPWSQTRGVFSLERHIRWFSESDFEIWFGEPAVDRCCPARVGWKKSSTANSQGPELKAFEDVERDLFVKQTSSIWQSGNAAKRNVSQLRWITTVLSDVEEVSH